MRVEEPSQDCQHLDSPHNINTLTANNASDQDNENHRHMDQTNREILKKKELYINSMVISQENHYFDIGMRLLQTNKTQTDQPDHQ